MNGGRAIGNLLIRQQEVNFEWRPTKEYDLLILGVSWESRATATLSIIAKGAYETVAIKFASKSTSLDELKEARAREMSAVFDPLGRLDLPASTDVQACFRALEDWVRDRFVAAGRPLRILIDITCIPKTYIVFLLGLGFTREYMACFDCLYAAGLYNLNAEETGDPTRVRGPRGLVSEGEWVSRLIPYFESSEVIAASRDLIVTLGGEFGMSLPFIERFEPTKLALIFIAETAPHEDLPMLASERSAVRELLAEPNVKRLDVGLGDLVSVANNAANFARKSDARAVTGLAIGSKPHALALGLAALSEKKMEIVCRTPFAYKSNDVEASGRFFFYSIEDRFEPLGYFGSVPKLRDGR